MALNLLKRWRDDFATVKRQRDVSGLFEKKQDAIPPHPSPSQALWLRNPKIITVAVKRSYYTPA
jgi:hypothetical protein